MHAHVAAGDVPLQVDRARPPTKVSKSAGTTSLPVARTPESVFTMVVPAAEKARSRSRPELVRLSGTARPWLWRVNSWSGFDALSDHAPGRLTTVPGTASSQANSPLTRPCHRAGGTRVVLEGGQVDEPAVVGRGGVEIVALVAVRHPAGAVVGNGEPPVAPRGDVAQVDGDHPRPNAARLRDEVLERAVRRQTQGVDHGKSTFTRCGPTPARPCAAPPDPGRAPR